MQISLTCRVFWIELIICGLSLPLVFFFMCETRGQVLYVKHMIAGKGAPQTANPMKELYSTLGRSTTLLITEPTVTWFTLWSSFAFGLVFISTQSIPIVFGNTFGWAAYSSGLVQSAIGIGQILGLVAALVQNRVYVNSANHNDQHAGKPIPEAILHLSIPSTAFGLAGGLFVYGWSIFQPHWIVSAVGLALTGFASMVIVNAASIYVTDSYSSYAASAIAAVAFGENAFAAFLPLAAKAMYLRLGFQWASSLLGFVAVALTLAPVALLWKGQAIRSHSKFNS